MNIRCTRRRYSYLKASQEIRRNCYGNLRYEAELSVYVKGEDRYVQIRVSNRYFFGSQKSIYSSKIKILIPFAISFYFIKLICLRRRTLYSQWYTVLTDVQNDSLYHPLRPQLLVPYVCLQASKQLLHNFIRRIFSDRYVWLRLNFIRILTRQLL